MMYSSLQQLLQLLKEDNTVSSYELQTTGLVTALLNCLNLVCICLIFALQQFSVTRAQQTKNLHAKTRFRFAQKMATPQKIKLFLLNSC